MAEDEMSVEEALAYIQTEYGKHWSRKTLANRSSGSQASIRKISRVGEPRFRKSDIDAFFRAETRITNAYGVR